MKQYIPVLRKTKMFSGVGDEEIETMLSCLNARCSITKKANMSCGRAGICGIF